MCNSNLQRQVIEDSGVSHLFHDFSNLTNYTIEHLKPNTEYLINVTFLQNGPTVPTFNVDLTFARTVMVCIPRAIMGLRVVMEPQYNKKSVT